MTAQGCLNCHKKKNAFSWKIITGVNRAVKINEELKKLRGQICAKKNCCWSVSWLIARNYFSLHRPNLLIFFLLPFRLTLKWPWTVTTHSANQNTLYLIRHAHWNFKLNATLLWRHLPPEQELICPIKPCRRSDKICLVSLQCVINAGITTISRNLRGN